MHRSLKPGRLAEFQVAGRKGVCCMYRVKFYALVDDARHEMYVPERMVADIICDKHEPSKVKQSETM
jgi:hypothetical protein